MDCQACKLDCIKSFIIRQNKSKDFNNFTLFDEAKAQEIMEHNLVCSNFFDWDFENWCPIKENV